MLTHVLTQHFQPDWIGKSKSCHSTRHEDTSFTRRFTTEERGDCYQIKTLFSPFITTALGGKSPHQLPPLESPCDAPVVGGRTMDVIGAIPHHLVHTV
ncbi:hypothetical protein J6590_025153 [Homalodisca vitripennis]|nr:hypothetical protein J6590_025153 [Homalodisca vitripennis]